MTKSDVSEVLKGFQKDKKGQGFDIVKVKAWDYPSLITCIKKLRNLQERNIFPQ